MSDIARRLGKGRRDFPSAVGRALSYDSVRGYYIDLTPKAAVEPSEDAAMDRSWLHVVNCQWGLGCFDRYLTGEGERWLHAALRIGRHLLGQQERKGPLAGAWRHRKPLGHTYDLRAGWVSAMAQGEGASLFVRLFLETREEAFAEGALKAVNVLQRSVEDGGVRRELRGGPFLEEYPTDPPSYVLNGAIFAAWGYHDVGRGLQRTDMLERFDSVAGTLAANLDRWDLGYWSRYDLFPHRTVNVAAPWYHMLHIHQLRVLSEMTERSEFATMSDRWMTYSHSATKRVRALLRKAVFRLVVPKRQLAN